MKTVSARGLTKNFRGDMVPIDAIQHASTYEVTADGKTETTSNYDEAVEMVADLVHYDGMKLSDDTPREMVDAIEDKVKELASAPAMAM
ncbi:hypothetical protein [Salipiger sp. PrR003]|uniref:hypothetical protein n=1 Tax=Salipiger sp. PrR003 TaxID=2706776 RepID=UPI0013D8EC0B|nr:hypothetical protein [Salipiger sp. PrR003]NDV50642.1 hypothetical protein [Salipiger sp. PrR003]